MGVLRVDHPDILDFIACKSDQSVLNGFNISVGITDEFMNAYLNRDLYFNLISPRTGQVVKQAFTQDIMAEIVNHAHRNGEPGVLFLDTINKKNPLPNLYKIETTNPCVTSDAIIMTSTGERQVKDLVGVDFFTHEGSLCKNGFYLKEYVPTVTIRTRRGHSLRCSYQHRIMIHSGRWVEAGKLSIGDKVPIHNESDDIIVGLVETKDRVTGGSVHEAVFDCTVNSFFHCYISNGFYSHNCGEQALGPYEVRFC